jgi:hypothetical protein
MMTGLEKNTDLSDYQQGKGGVTSISDGSEAPQCKGFHHQYRPALEDD